MTPLLTGLPIVSRKTSPFVLFVFIVAGLGLGRPLHAEGPGIEAFFGRYEGRAITEGDGQTTKRDLDVRIEPAGAKGDGQFQITWGTVIRRRDAEDKRKSYSILFKRTSRPGIFASAMRADMFGNAVPLDPLKGEPFVWCRIAGRTLTVYALLITDSGSFDLQVYDRTLRDGGLDLRFTRFDEGKPPIVVTATLEKVGD